jgi:hypothetical protein
MSKIKASTTTTTAYQVEADTTGTLVLQTGATPTTAVTIGSDQSVSLAGTLAVQSQNMTPYTGFKNRIINGAMVIDQYNAGASITPVQSQFVVDRFKMLLSQSGKFTSQQNAGSVTPPTGFKNYIGLTVGASANVTVGTSDYFALWQKIEGYNIADLGWGASGASSVTLSFWVRSSVTGTFGGALQNGDQNRFYPFTYTINAANTWEQKSVTIAGDTSGTWLTTNGVGVNVTFSLGSGSTYSGTAGAWAGTNYTSATGATSVVGTSGATFYITGVQLEKGSTATSFDYRPYGTELALCQRYCNVLRPNASSSGICSGFWYTTTVTLNSFVYPVQMRSAPTLSYSALSDFYAVNTTGGNNVSAFSISNAGVSNCRLDVTSSGGTAGQGGIIQTATTSSVLTFSAEL